MNKIFLADLVLLILNIFWGYCFLIIKELLIDIPPFQIIAVRFLFAAVLLLPFHGNKFRNLRWPQVKLYSLTGLALGIGFSFQTIGISYTSPSKAGVFTGMLVAFVPFFYFFIHRKKIEIHSLLGSIISFLGLGLFSLQDFKEYYFQIGDILLLSCAIVYALHIVLIDLSFQKFPETNESFFAFFQIVICGLIGLIFTISFEKINLHPSNHSVVLIFVLSIFGSLLAYIIQSWAQKYSPPSHVGVILCTESIFACIFSYFLLGDRFSLEMIIGGLLVFLGILITEGIFKPSLKKSESNLAQKSDDQNKIKSHQKIEKNF